jgi:hypothetical protein
LPDVFIGTVDVEFSIFIAAEGNPEHRLTTINLGTTG